MERLHITVFGAANSGKSTLVNSIAGQEVSLVSPVAGTTTDPVRKLIEIPGLGPCVLTDTAGYDDDGPLGQERRRLTLAETDSTDVAVLLVSGHPLDSEWKALLTEEEIPVVEVHPGEESSAILERIAAARPEGEESSLTGELVKAGDTVILVMPQDSEAPKGRLILPQVQVIRDLLDRGCRALCCKPEGLADALGSLSSAPSLVITDSQVFREVESVLPQEIALTSFSILLASEKGDPAVFIEGARAIDRLGSGSRVLIAEACTHVPAGEDIGRVKIPALLRRRIDAAGGNGEALRVDVAAGNDFPQDLSAYDLIIHCGACVANSRLVRSRIKKALRAGVPITNYGIALAYLQGILDRVRIRVPQTRKQSS